jgi:hypothetical protein
MFTNKHYLTTSQTSTVHVNIHSWGMESEIQDFTLEVSLLDFKAQSLETQGTKTGDYL